MHLPYPSPVLSMLSWMSTYDVLQCWCTPGPFRGCFLSVKILMLGLVEIPAVHVATASKVIFAAIEAEHEDLV